MSRCNVALNELTALEKDKNNAIDYLKKERSLMLLKNMEYFIDLGDGVDKMNKCLKQIDDRKQVCRTLKDQKKSTMEQNAALVSEI